MNRILLTLIVDGDGKPCQLQMDQGEQYSNRAYNRMIGQSRQHQRQIIDSELYDLIVPRICGESLSAAPTERTPIFRREFLSEIIAKVHSGQVQFKKIEFEPKPKGRK